MCEFKFADWLLNIVPQFMRCLLNLVPQFMSWLVNITPQFVNWLLDEDLEKWDEHWMPVSLRCRWNENYDLNENNQNNLPLIQADKNKSPMSPFLKCVDSSIWALPK